MRMILDVELPLEPFNTMVKNGTAGAAIEKALADIKPEAVYFCEHNGVRGGYLVVDIADPSKIPSVGEPLFLSFNASVKVHPVMTPEDLAKAGLDELGKKYS